MLHIKRFSEVQNKDQVLKELRGIFFKTSSRTEFSSDDAREEFFKTWTSYYVEHLPSYVYLATGAQSEVIGYLTGCPDTREAMKKFSHDSMQTFKDLYDSYSAHFHINCDPAAQGQGIGSALTVQFLEDLKSLKIGGVHIITSPSAANVKFYEKLGFDFKEERPFKNVPLLFMGKKLF